MHPLLHLLPVLVCAWTATVAVLLSVADIRSGVPRHQRWQVGLVCAAAAMAFLGAAVSLNPIAAWAAERIIP